MASGNTGIPGISFIPAVGLTTQTYDGFPGGVNLASPAQEIDDTQARYLQDILLDQPGLTRRRGPVQAVSGIATLPRKGTNLIAALNPQGNARYSVLTGDASNGYLTTYSSDMSTLVDLDLPFPMPTDPGADESYNITDIKPALHGGAWIGVSSAYDANSPNQMLGLWFGGTKADATITVTGTRGSQTVTGTGFTANVDPGMYLFADTNDPYSQAYIGTVKTVDSNTSLTLTGPSPYAFTSKSGTFQSVRGFAPKVSKGELTTDTASTAVTGGDTKFRSQKMDTGTTLTGTLTSGAATVTGLSSTTGLTKGMPVTGTNVGTGARIQSVDSSSQVTLTVNSTGSGSESLTFKVPWDIYRASDGTWVGTVLTIDSEVGLTLMANAAIAMSDEAFVALRADANFDMQTTGTTQKVGFVTANYADRQWYFNNGEDYATTSRGWFSDTNDPEIVDMSDYDGDWVDIISTANVNEPIRGAQAAFNGLMVFKETETFLISGTSPTSFGVRKLEDDGCTNNGSIQPYAGGVIWAGREGIWLYDGIQSKNLTVANLGDYYRNTIRTFDPTKYRMWSMVDRDHYMLFLESVEPTVAVVKGNTSTTPTKMTFVVNLVSGAITFFTNVNLRGSVVLPGSSGRSTWFLVNGQQAGDTADHAIICDGEALFTEEGNDLVWCDYADAAGSWTNIVPNGGAEVDLSNIYGAGSVTVTRDAAFPVYGSWAIKAVTGNVTSDEGCYFQLPSSSMQPNTAYTASVDIKGSVGSVLKMQINEAHLGGFVVAQVHVLPTLVDTDTHRYTFTFTTGPTTDSVQLFVMTQGQQSTTFYMDGGQIELGSVAHPYVDTTNGAASGSPRRNTPPISPDFYIETKKFDGGDGLRLKRFKQLAVWYLAQGDAMKVDAVMGLNNIGQTLTSDFPASAYTWGTLSAVVSTWAALSTQFATWSSLVQSVFVPKRVRFQKKNQYVSFRLYQASDAVTRMQLGPFQVGYKLQRPGRI